MKKGLIVCLLIMLSFSGFCEEDLKLDIKVLQGMTLHLKEEQRALRKGMIEVYTLFQELFLMYDAAVSLLYNIEGYELIEMEKNKKNGKYGVVCTIFTNEEKKAFKKKIKTSMEETTKKMEKK